MSKLIEEIPLVGLTLDSSLSVPLYKQLYNALRKQILERKLINGQKLPGSRSLAAELGISRNTVTLAFEQLRIEGYIKGSTGSGTYVSGDVPDKFVESGKIKYTEGSKKKQSLPALVTKSYEPLTLLLMNRRNEPLIPFQTGTAALDKFPLNVWLKLTNRIGQGFSYLELGYGDAAGYKPLREVIANYLRAYRAVRCSAEQIIIINGSQQGLDLICKVLLKQTSKVWLEDPGYLGARMAFISHKAGIYPVPVDEEGLNLDYAVSKYPKPELIYTTPSHQYPLGCTMSISRRIKLLEWAVRNKAYIIEDDYDSEFRYTGHPLPSIQGMSADNPVFYLGTFSKVLFPGIRLGYLVLPSIDMMEIFSAVKSITDRFSPTFEQMVLARFIEEGHFTKHIRRMRTLYKERQEFLIHQLNKELGDFLEVKAGEAGMHVIGWLTGSKNDKLISAAAKKIGVTVNTLSDYSIKFPGKPGLLLGYAAFNEKQIKEGVKKICTVFYSTK